MRNLVFGGESGLLGRGLNNFNLCMEKSFEVLSKWPVRTAYPRPLGFHPLVDVPFLAPEHREPVPHCRAAPRVALLDALGMDATVVISPRRADHQQHPQQLAHSCIFKQ